MESLPPGARLARFLLLSNAAIWLVFGGIAAAGALPLGGPGPARWILAGGSFLVAGCTLALTYFIQRHSRLAYWSLVALLAAAALANLFDQFGPVDLLFMIIALVPLALLLKERGWYLSK